MQLDERARIHAALGDRSRLAIVDELRLSDRTPQELGRVASLPGNLLAHHLGVLEAAGLIRRHTSEGDRRRRYISLVAERFDGLGPQPLLSPEVVLRVHPQLGPVEIRRCALASAHRAHSPERRNPSRTAGAPRAIRAADAFGLDLSTDAPRGYEQVAESPDLVVSVCDRARESGLPFSAPALHWSVPDPVRARTIGAFRSAFADITRRVDQLVASS